MEINDSHVCVFCTRELTDHSTTILCSYDEHDEFPHQFNPAGDAVLFGQIIDGKAVVTVNEDLTSDEIALLMAAFMDRISNFEHIKRDPSAIMKALMGDMNG